MPARTLLIALAIALLLAAPAGAVDIPSGGLDPSFDSDGKVTTGMGGGPSDAQALLVQSDGKLVAAGYGDNPASFAIARYNANGSLDGGFSGDGRDFATFSAGAGDESLGFAVVRQLDGKYVVAGHAKVANIRRFAAARFLANGGLDPGFGTNGVVSMTVGDGMANDNCKGLGYYSAGAYGVALQTDGRIVLAGCATSGTVGKMALVRLNTDGSPDNGIVGQDLNPADSFGTAGVTLLSAPGFDYSGALSVMVLPDQSIMAAGGSGGLVGERFTLARLTAGGAPDNNFDGDGIVTHSISTTLTSRAFGAARQTDGKIILAGAGTATGAQEHFTVARFDTAGGNDGFSTSAAFPGTKAFAGGVTIDGMGRAVLAGRVGTGVGIARYTSAGVLDTTFNDDGRAFVDVQAPPADTPSHTGVAVQADGKIVVAESQVTQGNVGNFIVMRVLGEEQLDDTDGDGVPDRDDNCDLTDNPDQANFQMLDMAGDACDDDDDNDGVVDVSDACPMDPSDSIDTDGDHTCDNADSDDDNDGLLDADEAIAGTNPLKKDTDDDKTEDLGDNCRTTPNDQRDTDNDGAGDACDADDDADRVPDRDDLCRLIKAPTQKRKATRGCPILRVGLLIDPAPARGGTRAARFRVVRTERGGPTARGAKIVARCLPGCGRASGRFNGRSTKLSLWEGRVFRPRVSFIVTVTPTRAGSLGIRFKATVGRNDFKIVRTSEQIRP